MGVLADNLPSTMPNLAPPWTCPNCGLVRNSPYCPECGEEPLRGHHLSITDVAHQTLTALSEVDGRLLRSLRFAITRPGALTSAYVAGRRTPFLNPFALFLIANGVFFALQSAVQANIFASPLESHLHHQDWSALAQTLVAGRLAAKDMTLASYAPLFDQFAVLYAKSLIILMVFVFAGIVALMFWNRRRPFGAHVVFALHFYVFQLLLFCGALLLANGERALGGGGLNSWMVDITLTVVNLTLCAIYLRAAIREVYAARGITGAGQMIALALASIAMVPVYRFTIFLITLYLT